MSWVKRIMRGEKSETNSPKSNRDDKKKVAQHQHRLALELRAIEAEVRAHER